MTGRSRVRGKQIWTDRLKVFTASSSSSCSSSLTSQLKISFPVTNYLSKCHPPHRHAKFVPKPIPQSKNADVARKPPTAPKPAKQLTGRRTNAPVVVPGTTSPNSENVRMGTCTKGSWSSSPGPILARAWDGERVFRRRPRT